MSILIVAKAYLKTETMVSESELFHKNRNKEGTPFVFVDKFY
jgi:hypothetical protein